MLIICDHLPRPCLWKAEAKGELKAKSDILSFNLSPSPLSLDLNLLCFLSQIDKGLGVSL